MNEQTTLPGDERLMNAAEVAKKFNVSPSWVRQHSNGTRQPTLPSVLIGRTRRFLPSEVQAFLRQHGQGA